MKLSFMTLGCPDWDLETICLNGRAYGFDGVDFRGYLNTLDITQLPEFTSGIADTRRRLNAAGLQVSGISSSIAVCDGGKFSANLEEAKRTIGLAKSLGCDVVRVFGGGDANLVSRAELVEVGIECVGRILDLDGAEDIHWLLETHDIWVKSKDCRLMLDAIPDEEFGILWDMGHTCRIGGEAPQDFWESVLGRVGYAHVKDAVYAPDHPLAMADGWRYVLPGSGQLPLGDCLDVLDRSGYTGWLLFEHEKRWHPNLPDPEIAFPAFMRWANTVMEGRGYGTIHT